MTPHLPTIDITKEKYYRITYFKTNHLPAANGQILVTVAYSLFQPPGLLRNPAILRPHGANCHGICSQPRKRPSSKIHRATFQGCLGGAGNPDPISWPRQQVNLVENAVRHGLGQCTNNRFHRSGMAVGGWQLVRAAYGKAPNLAPYEASDLLIPIAGFGITSRRYSV